MKTRLTLALLATAAVAMPAVAQQINSGGETGAYFGDFGPTGAAVLSSQPPAEIKNLDGALPNGPLYMDYPVVTSAGTGENISRCQENPMDICLGQGDVVSAVPGMTVIPTGAKECLFAVTNDPTVTAMQSAGARIPWALPSEASGSAATFAKSSGIMDLSFRNVTYYDGTDDAIAAVAAGDANIAFFVQLPDTSNQRFKDIDDAGLTFLPVVSRAFQRYEENGIRPYSIQPDVRVTPGGFFAGDPQYVTTACVDVVFFFQDPETSGLTGNDLLDMQDIETALRAAANAGLLIPDTGDWRDMFGDLRAKAGAGLDAALEKLEAETGVQF